MPRVPLSNQDKYDRAVSHIREEAKVRFPGRRHTCVVAKRLDGRIGIWPKNCMVRNVRRADVAGKVDRYSAGGRLLTVLGPENDDEDLLNADVQATDEILLRHGLNVAPPASPHVDVRLLARDGTWRVFRAMVDTGMDLSNISTAALRSLGYDARDIAGKMDIETQYSIVKTKYTALRAAMSARDGGRALRFTMMNGYGSSVILGRNAIVALGIVLSDDKD